MSKGYMYDIIKRECGIISSCREVSEKSPAEMDSRIKDEKCKIIVFREKGLEGLRISCQGGVDGNVDTQILQQKKKK